MYRQETANGAALGAALRAAQAFTNGDWDDIVGPFTKPLAGSKVEPDPAAAAVYESLLPAYAAFEAEALQS